MMRVLDALCECPLNDWVSFDDFSLFMQATGREFTVAYDLWSLYIADPEHGNLGYLDVLSGGRKIPDSHELNRLRELHSALPQNNPP